MKSHPIALTYAYPIAFTAAVFALCHWGWGDSGAVLFRKVFFAPMFLLAGRGLRTYFTCDNDRTRSTATQAEFQFLTALTVSGFVLSIGPFEANSFGRSIALLLIMAAAMTILNMGFFLFGIECAAAIVRPFTKVLPICNFQPRPNPLKNLLCVLIS